MHHNPLMMSVDSFAHLAICIRRRKNGTSIDSRVNFTAWQTVKMIQPRIPLEQHYSYERGLSRAVSSDARARASRSAFAMEPLPRGNQTMPATRTTARNTMAVARLNRIPSMKSLSATARIAFCVAGLRCLIGSARPDLGRVSAGIRVSDDHIGDFLALGRIR